MTVYRGSVLGSDIFPLHILSGKAVKLIVCNNPSPFNFKVTGYAKNNSSIVGYTDEGENQLIKIKDIDFIHLD